MTPIDPSMMLTEYHRHTGKITIEKKINTIIGYIVSVLIIDMSLEHDSKK